MIESQIYHTLSQLDTSFYYCLLVKFVVITS